MQDEWDLQGPERKALTLPWVWLGLHSLDATHPFRPVGGQLWRNPLEVGSRPKGRLQGTWLLPSPSQMNHVGISRGGGQLQGTKFSILGHGPTAICAFTKAKIAILGKGPTLGEGTKLQFLGWRPTTKGSICPPGGGRALPQKEPGRDSHPEFIMESGRNNF
jgi:hypothetical protein